MDTKPHTAERVIIIHAEHLRSTAFKLARPIWQAYDPKIFQDPAKTDGFEHDKEGVAIITVDPENIAFATVISGALKEALEEQMRKLVGRRMREPAVGASSKALPMAEQLSKLRDAQEQSVVLAYSGYPTDADFRAIPTNLSDRTSVLFADTALPGEGRFKLWDSLAMQLSPRNQVLGLAGLDDHLKSYFLPADQLASAK